MSQAMPMPIPPTGPPPGWVQYYVYLYENGTWSVGQSPIAPPIGGMMDTGGMCPPPPPPCNKDRMKEALINILSDNSLFSNNFNKSDSPWKR